MAARSSRFTVRARVTAFATLILAVALVVGAVVANRLLVRALIDDVDASLENRLDQVIALTTEGRLTAVLVPTGQDLAQLQVIDPDGRVIAATPGLAPGARLDVIDRPQAGREERATVDGSRIGGKAGDDYRLIARTITGGQQSVTIYAVTSLATATRAESHLRLGMALGLPLVIALAAWLIWFVTGRALAPVDQMRAEVDQIQATDLTRRVSPAGGDSEIDRLGATLNHMLERLQDAADRQHLFAASASHELRSPLSAIRTELEVGLAYPDRADWARVAHDSLVEVGRLEGLARDLRTLTGARSAAAGGGPTDLGTVIREEIARRQPERGVRYVTTGAGAVVAVDRTSLAGVVRNLFDNAERHAATTVEVTLAVAAETVELTVGNDGRPVPPEMRERIFEPFTRLDEARSLDEGGSGLGLAIARAVALAAGGALVALDDDRGATFRLSLPMVPAVPTG